MNFFGTACLIVLLSVITSAARTNKATNPCSMKCSSSEDSLFKKGQIYTYSYEGESEIKTINGLYETTGLLIKSQVTITGLSNCEMKLSMSNVKIFDRTSKDGKTFQESPNSEKIKNSLEKNEVFFTRENEKVKSICMNEDEPVWSENLKKVIIDSLANQGDQTQKHATQMTSHGNCYIPNKTTEKTSSGKIVKFDYDLRYCENEKMPKSIFTDLTQATLFEMSEVFCEYKYNGERDLGKIQCKEGYTMIPFRQNSNRIVIQIKSTLTKENQIASKVLEFSGTNVIETGVQQSQDEYRQGGSSYTSVKETLQEICKQKVASTSSEIPQMFMKLINQLKDLNSKEFKELYLYILKTDICPGQESEIRSIFYDAVGFVNTPAATSVMVDLIKSNHLSVFDQNVWLASLSFMQQTPTIEMLKDLESLISTENPTSPMYLGISAVTHLYCKNNFKACLYNPTIKSILSKFLINLNNDCSQPKDSDKDYISKIQISLKALGNLKFFSDEVTDVLTKCVSTKTNPLSIRISALEVMKHMDCKKDRSSAMAILENNENDSELRINAYLTVMGCSDINTLFKVREILAKEKVNQVGSFIWTHLTNLKETTDSMKQSIRELLDNVELKKVFDLSKLKFSRNIEKTFKTNNFGMTFDSNIIFSEKSFVPRSVSLNTTALILGRGTNFMELSARLEGLEDLLYKLFGPEGYMKKQTTAEDNLALINMLNEMNGNMNIKLYGQQISFIELMRGSLGSVKKYNIIEEIMNWSQNKNFELNKNMQLIDKTAVIPTMLGLPLRLKLQGSVSVNIKIQSKVELDGLFSWPIAFNIDNHISPNINAEFNADIVLQAPFSEYGMSLNLKSGTNTELKAKIYASKNEEFSIKFDTPKMKQEVISVEGKTYVIHRNNKILQLSDKMKEFEVCPEKESTTRSFGVKFCGKVKYIDSAYNKNTLFNGPFSASLFIEKQDSQTGYIIRGSSKSASFISENGQRLTNRFIKFELDTPNSSVYDRRFFGEFTLDFKEKHFKLELTTPWNQVLMISTFKLTEDEKKIRLNLQLNKEDIIDIMAEHTRISTTKGSKIRCGITVAIMKLTPITAVWNLNALNEGWVFSFLSKGLMKENTQVKIKIDKVKSTRELSLFNKYLVSGFYNSYFGNGKISGIASENYYGHRWDVKLKHKPRDNTESEFMLIFRHKTEDKSSKNLNKYILTTTFAYGKNAENIFKLKTETELSDKHIRASLKAGSGIGDTESVTDLVDLRLYGGYRWKEDDRHYAEGSLSIKLPTTNVNYEGRYNSEVGKKMFKMSLALDKDQQSKLNLRINYLQPKLYLKNTNCEVTFSIPNCNIDVKWNLEETDVNKYKYTLETKYNNHNMRFDGVQTQISRFNHDSFVTLKMTNIGDMPKQTNINLKINLVDLSKASIQAKVDIPDSDYDFSIDTQFSYTPQNLLQLSTTNINSVFKYEIELSSKGRVMKSKCIFTCNPEEFQAYFNLKTNSLKYPNHQIEFDIHSLHKNPNYKQFNNFARISISYPVNRHSIEFKSEFKYTEMMSQIDFIWNKDQRISIHTMYEIDNSWTQKGLRSSLTIKTPFKDFEQTHFGINAVGELRYRKVDFECKWGSNKKIVFDIIIHPKSSNDFSLSWKLATPFHGWNLISFQSKHMHSYNSINTQASLEIGPSRRYQIKLEAVNNGEGKNRDLLANVLIESGIYPAFKLSIVHKDDSVHYKSNLNVLWMKTVTLDIKSDVSFTLEDSELITKGNIEWLSTINVLKQMKAIWSIDNRNGQFQNNIELLHNSKNVLQSEIKGYYEYEHGTFKMEFNGLATVMNGRSLRIASNLNYLNIYNIQHQFSISQDINVLYSHNLAILKDSCKLKFLIPRTEFKTIEIESIVNKMDKKSVTFFKIGEKHLFHLTEQYATKLNEDKSIEIDFAYKLNSDFLSIKKYDHYGKITYNKHYIKFESTTKDEAGNHYKVLFDYEYGPKKQVLHIGITSNYELLKQINLNYENIRNENNKFFNINLGLALNELTKFNGKISFEGFQLIDIDMSSKYRGIHKFFKLKHNNNEDLLDTNVFGKRIRFVSSIEWNRGFSLKWNLNGDFRYLKSFEIFARLNRDGESSLIWQIQRDSKGYEKFKVNYSNLKGFYKLSIDTPLFDPTEMKLDMKKFKNMYFVVKSPTTAEKPKLRLSFNYEVGKDPMKHYSDLKVNFGDYEFELQNKMENVKWKYLLIESEVKSNYKYFNNMKIGFEYRVKPSKFLLNLKANFNDDFMKLATNIESNSELKIDLKMESSSPMLKEVSIELGQKHNNYFTNMKHKSKVIVRSNENVFQFENNIQWFDLYYTNIDLSISGKSSGNNFFIEPKLFQFKHKFETYLLEEYLHIRFSENTYMKMKIEQNMPIEEKSKSLYEFESSFPILKKFSVQFDINIPRNKVEMKSVSLKIQRNGKNLLNWQSKYINGNKLLSFVTDLELLETHKTGLKIDLTETTVGTYIARVKLFNSLLKQHIDLNAKFISSLNDLSITILGAAEKQIVINARAANKQYVLKMQYGSKIFDLDIKFNGINGVQHIKLILKTDMNINSELLLSSDYFKVSGKLNNHSFNIIGKRLGGFKFNFNILNTEMSVILNRSPSRNGFIFDVDGTSNLKEWKEFKTQLKMINDNERFHFETFFKKESKTMMKFNLEYKFSRSFSIQYSTSFDLLEFGNLELNFEDIPKKLMLDLKVKSYGKESIKGKFKLDGSTIQGQLQTPFEWIRDIIIEGRLTNANDIIKGTLFIKHNKLDKDINGKFSLEIKSNLFKLELETPLSHPYNEFSLRSETSNTKYIMEVSDKENKWFSYKFIQPSQNKYQIDLDVMVPKIIKDITFSLSTDLNLDVDATKFKLIMKSTVFDELKVEITSQKGEYQIRFSHPSKEGQLQLKISEFQTFGQKVAVVAKYGESSHEAELEYEILDVNDIYLKIVGKSSKFLSSSADFEVLYKHKLIFPNHFNLDTKWKFNDKTIFYKSISWKRQLDKSFELLWKTTLSLYEKERETKIELVSNRGETFKLIISAPEILNEPINVQIVTKLEDLGLSIQSGFEWAKSISINIRTELKPIVWTQVGTFESNMLGKYEMRNEINFESNFERKIQISSQINTPSTNKKIYSQIILKNSRHGQVISCQLELDGKVYSLHMSREYDQIEVRLQTPLEYLNQFQYIMTIKPNTYEITIIYNQHQSKFIVSKHEKLANLKVESNSSYFKTVSLSIEWSKISEFQKSIKITILKDQKNFKWNSEIDLEKTSLKYSSENDLFVFLPKSLAGKIQYSSDPIDMAVELKLNDVTILQIVLNKDQVLFHSQLKVLKTSMTEVKFSAKKWEIQFILLADDVFSILVTRTKPNQIDATIMISQDQYSMRFMIENVKNSFLLKLSTFKNSVEKLLEMNNEINKQDGFIDFDVNYRSRSIFKLKLTHKNMPMRIVSLETKVLSFDGVVDFVLDRRMDLTNLKLSWNFLYSGQQLPIGSIVYVWKSSRPLNFLTSINLHNMAFQAQLIESDKGEFQFKISSPFKGFDIDLKWLLERESDMYKLQCSFENSFTGEFSVKSRMRLYRDPEFKFLLTSTMPIISYKFNLITSVKNQLTFNTELQLFNGEKISFEGKLSTKDLIELIAVLNTPFRFVRTIKVEKTIKFISIFEHTYDTTIIYDGITKMKYIGKHEIFLEKRIFKFQNSFHNEDVKITSLEIDHSGSYDKLDHSFVWHFREQKFGVKLNGGFKPLFEGKSEIFTPFHNAGKFVVMGKQMKNGILLEAGKDNEQIVSLEYVKEKSVRFLKVTPPSDYGKSLEIKYETRRFKRALDSEIQSEVRYGTEKIIEWYSNVKTGKEEYNANFNLAAPKLTRKSVEIFLSHKFNEKAIDFDHKVTVKDSFHEIYRLFGSLIRENPNHFEMSVNSEHPNYGSNHLSFGHSLTENNYENQFLMKSGDRTVIMHKGNLKFDQNKMTFNADWKTQINSHHHRLTASHSGNWKDFVQSLSMEYNNLPYFLFKSQSIQQRRSNIEIEFPTIDGCQIRIAIDTKENKLECSLKTKFVNHLVEIIDNNGNLQILYKSNDRNVASLSTEYGTNRLYIKGNYLENSGTLEMSMENSVFNLKMLSSSKKCREVQLKISSNKFKAAIDYYGYPHTINGEFKYSPDYIFASIETSLIHISKIQFEASPTQCKFTFNEFFQTLNFIIKRNHVQLIGKNNFMFVRTFLFDFQSETPNKFVLQLQLNSFTSKSMVEFSEDKIIANSENNFFPLLCSEFQMSRQIEKDLKYWVMNLSADKIERFKVQFQIKNQHYSLGLKTYFGQDFVVSYHRPQKELIVSLKSNDHYLNIINKMKSDMTTDTKTFIIVTDVDSSLVFLRKLKNEFIYSITDSSCQLKMSTNYDGRTLIFGGDFSKSQIHIFLNKDDVVYSGTISAKSTKDLDLKITMPGHKLIMKFRREGDKYSCDIQCNGKAILNVIIKQKQDLVNFLKHESTISYRGKIVWNFNLETNFRKYEIKMMAPRKFNVTVTNDWKDQERISLGFLVSYGLFMNKPIKYGAGIKFQFNNLRRSHEIYIENSFRIISWAQSFDVTEGQQTILGLLNKESKDHWELTFKSIREKKFEMIWKSPTGIKEIKYNQIIENSIRTMMDLDILGIVKFNLKSDKYSQNSWSGSLTTFSYKIATIKVGKDDVTAMINEGAPEKDRIFLKWTMSSKGQWKKDYLSTKQLIVKQKAMNIDLDVLHQTRMESKVYSTSTTINHQLMDGSRKTWKFGAGIDFRKSNQISLELQNPILPIKTVLHRSQLDETSIRYEMETQFNDNDNVHGFFILSAGSNPGITSKLYYNPEDKSEFLQIHSKYIDDRQMETHIFTEKNSKKTTYFQVLLRLLNEHHLETTFEWKANMLSKLYNTVRQYNNQLLSRTFLVLSSEMTLMTIEKRFQQFMKVIPNSQSFVIHLNNVINHVDIELSTILKEYLTMNMMNDFFMRTILDNVLDALSWSLDFPIKSVRISIAIIEQTQVVITQFIQFIIRIGFRFYERVLPSTRNILHPIKQVVLFYSYKIYDNLSTGLIPSLEHMVVSMSTHIQRVVSMAVHMNKVSKVVFLNHVHKVLDRTIRFVKGIATTFHPNSFDFLKHEKEIKIIYNNFVDELEKASDRLMKVIHSLMNQADDNLSLFTGDKYFQTMGKALSAVFKYLIEQLRDERYKTMVKRYIYSSISESFQDMEFKMGEITRDLIWPYVALLDYNKGQRLDNEKDFRMVVRYTTPIPINDLKSFPDFNYVTRKIQKIKRIFVATKRSWNNRLFWGYKYIAMKNWFTLSLPAFSLPSVLPEFENYATISKTSVVTFDKQSFQLNSGACRILLSKDNRFKRWEIILNQRQDGRFYSINIGSNTIDISGTDYKVQLNGKPSELPIIIGTTSLIGLGRVLKLKDENLGLTITVDPMNEMFTVGLSGWYHGKVRGLLGNSDNEPFNDLMLENGKIVSRDGFTKEFNYGGSSCVIDVEREQKLKPRKHCPFIRRVACKFIFECPFSPMAACFKTVDPTRFRDMCIDSDDELQAKLDPAVCNAVRQYQAQCNQAGINVQLPLPCRKCDVKNEKPISVNEFQTIKIKDKASDIIFIVDEGHCLNSLKPKLSNIISLLETEMHTKGITSVDFGLITFVDDYINEANFHTVGQKMLGSSDELIRSLKTLKPSNGKFKDVAGAITLAYNYPFREHASRHIVMISCQSVTELPIKLQTVSDKLQEKAIHFSLLTDFTFQLKDSNLKTIIFGVDSKNIYTPLSRTGDNNATTRPMNDILYKLTIKMKGVVFDYKYLTTNQELTQKSFLNTFVNQISQRATPARSSRCTCVDDGEFSCIPLDVHTIFPVTKVA